MHQGCKFIQLNRGIARLVSLFDFSNQLFFLVAPVDVPLAEDGVDEVDFRNHEDVWLLLVIPEGNFALKLRQVHVVSAME